MPLRPRAPFSPGKPGGPTGPGSPFSPRKPSSYLVTIPQITSVFTRPLHLIKTLDYGPCRYTHVLNTILRKVYKHCSLQEQLYSNMWFFII